MPLKNLMRTKNGKIGIIISSMILIWCIVSSYLISTSSPFIDRDKSRIGGDMAYLNLDSVLLMGTTNDIRYFQFNKICKTKVYYTYGIIKDNFTDSFITNGVTHLEKSEIHRYHGKRGFYLHLLPHLIVGLNEDTQKAAITDGVNFENIKKGQSTDIIWVNIPKETQKNTE